MKISLLWEIFRRGDQHLPGGFDRSAEPTSGGLSLKEATVLYSLTLDVPGNNKCALSSFPDTQPRRSPSACSSPHTVQDHLKGFASFF
jgi:hypothetical protein